MICSINTVCVRFNTLGFWSDVDMFLLTTWPFSVVSGWIFPASGVECREGLSGPAGVFASAAEPGRGPPPGGQRPLVTG